MQTHLKVCEWDKITPETLHLFVSERLLNMPEMSEKIRAKVKVRISVFYGFKNEFSASQLFLNHSCIYDHKRQLFVLFIGAMLTPAMTCELMPSLLHISEHWVGPVLQRCYPTTVL